MQLRQPAERGGVSAKSTEAIADGQARVGGDIRAGQARQRFERIRDGGIVGETLVERPAPPRGAVGVPLALPLGGRLDSVEQTRHRP